VPLDVEENAAPSVVTADAADVFKQKLMRRIELEETAVRQAESAHATNLELSKSYTRLGLSYSAAAQWQRSEAVMEHVVYLLRHNSTTVADLATGPCPLIEICT